VHDYAYLITGATIATAAFGQRPSTTTEKGGSVGQPSGLATTQLLVFPPPQNAFVCATGFSSSGCASLSYLSCRRQSYLGTFVEIAGQITSRPA
jgi:hypothetical protein